MRSAVTDSSSLSMRSTTAILTSRFLLDLQEGSQRVVRLDPEDPLHSSRNLYGESTPSFISSLGGFVNPDVLVPTEGDDSELHISSPSKAGEEEGSAQPESQAAETPSSV